MKQYEIDISCYLYDEKGTYFHKKSIYRGEGTISLPFPTGDIVLPADFDREKEEFRIWGKTIDKDHGAIEKRPHHVYGEKGEPKDGFYLEFSSLRVVEGKPLRCEGVEVELTESVGHSEEGSGSYKSNKTTIVLRKGGSVALPLLDTTVFIKNIFDDYVLLESNGVQKKLYPGVALSYERDMRVASGNTAESVSGDSISYVFCIVD